LCIASLLAYLHIIRLSSSLAALLLVVFRHDSFFFLLYFHLAR